MICRIQVNNIISFNETVKYIQERKWRNYDTLQRLHQLLDERGWSEYRLAKNCGLSNSTIANIYHRNTIPSISTLEAICTSFGISLSQFFAEGEMVELTPELKELFDNWVNLTPQQKDAVLQTMRAMNHDQT